MMRISELRLNVPERVPLDFTLSISHVLPAPNNVNSIVW